MAQTPTFVNDYLKLIFNAVAIEGIAQNAATAPVATYYVSLHLESPITISGLTAIADQGTVEASYTGYARMPVTRDVAGWKIDGSVVLPVEPIQFGECTGLPGNLTEVTAKFLGVGTTLSGPGKLLYVGTMRPQQIIKLGSAPRIDPFIGEANWPQGWTNTQGG